MRWVGQGTCVGENKNAYGLSLGKPEGITHLENLAMDGRIIMNIMELNPSREAVSSLANQ